VEGLTLVFLALLAGVVLYLVLSQRSFQRVDYSHLVQQEERERQTIARLKQAEALLATLREYEQARRLELDRFVAAAKHEIVEEVASARSAIVSSVLNAPDTYDQLLLAETGSLPIDTTQPGSALLTPRPGGENHHLLRFLRSPQQQRIAEMLECGFSHQEVSRDLGVSRTEVGLVSAIIFSEKTA
jgi:hypothetical protein